MNAHGTQLRLRAMVALGWSTWEIAGTYDLPQPLVAEIVTDDDTVVTAGVARWVATVYDMVSMTVPPDLGAPARQELRRFARTQGWLPPLGLDDDYLDDPGWVHGQVIVDRTWDQFDEAAVIRRLNGDRTAPITRADRLEIVARGRQRHMSYRDLLHVCGITKADRYIEPVAA